ncbi:MAG: hypothetical protein H7Y02_04010 [Candidatus Obscuribacterales bacterium]|nr:hypothetical protein [Steroidobacteraceae bacterium]
MRYANTLLASLMVVAASSVGLAGCDVKKTQEGDVSLPQYEVEKKKSGDVTLPQYEVTTPDVTITEKRTVVDVPKLTTEKETITVPSVEIKTGQEKAAEREQR